MTRRTSGAPPWSRPAPVPAPSRYVLLYPLCGRLQQHAAHDLMLCARSACCVSRELAAPAKPSERSRVCSSPRACSTLTGDACRGGATRREAPSARFASRFVFVAPNNTFRFLRLLFTRRRRSLFYPRNFSACVGRGKF